MAAIDSAKFRTDFPVFANPAVYQDSSIDFWIGIADQMLNTQRSARRWGANLALGEELFVAHNLILEQKAQKEVATGQTPGLTTGPTNSKSVDKVSIGYDVGSGIEVGAGHWNLTIYGTRFIRLAMATGSGGLQLGAGDCGNNGGFYGW